MLRDGEQIGEVTSGTFSPTLKRGIAMAYIRPGSAAIEDIVEVDVRGKLGEFDLVDPPFVRSANK